MKLTKKAMIIPAASLLLLGGCAKPSDYKDPISKFQAASAIVIANAEAEYTSINKKERDTLIDRSLAEGKEITILSLKETEFLTKDDLNARMNALDALKKHGELLFNLANSNAPDEAKQAVNSLDDAVLKLSSSLGQSPSSDFKTKSGAFVTIAGEVTQLVLNAKIKQALEKAITLSENDVSVLITLLENEMAAFRARQDLTRNIARSLATKEYNQELKKTNNTPEKIKEAAAKIKQTEDDWDKLALQPDPGFEKMNNAHQKLVQYAKKDRKSPEDIAELTAAMDTFADQAKIIADAIKTLQ